jgi:bifunctional UDP-N-acetylglucosamine pyrophosphorylase/glucosamine-1-phosphate N-acetyltransferase
VGGLFGKLEFVDQGAPKGTGHAVQVAMQALQGFVGDVLVIYGDCPLITPETLRELCELRGDAPCSVLTAHPEDPTGLGRILRDDDGRFVGIREDRDCSPDERRSTRSTPASTASTARRCGPRSAGLRRTTRRASST